MGGGEARRSRLTHSFINQTLSICVSAMVLAVFSPHSTGGGKQDCHPRGACAVLGKTEASPARPGESWRRKWGGGTGTLQGRGSPQVPAEQTPAGGGRRPRGPRGPRPPAPPPRWTQGHARAWGTGPDLARHRFLFLFLEPKGLSCRQNLRFTMNVIKTTPFTNTYRKSRPVW